MIKIPFLHHLTTANLHQLIRYGTVTALSYIVLLGGTYLAVEGGGGPNWVYPLILGLIYIGVYIAYIKFVFRVPPSHGNAVRFIIVLALSWGASNILFWILYNVWHIHYLIAMIANIFFLGGFRFLLQKFFVFKRHD